MRILKDVFQFWPGRVLGPFIGLAIAVLVVLALPHGDVWRAAPAPLQDLVLSAAAIPISAPVRIHDAPNITVTKGELVGARSITELARSWVSGTGTQSRIGLNAPEIVIGGPARSADLLQGLNISGASSVVVTNATIRLAMAVGRELRFEGVSAEMHFGAGGRMHIVSGTARYAGRPLGFSLDIEPRTSAAHDHGIRISLTGKGLALDLHATLSAGGSALDDGRLKVEMDDAADIANWLGLSFDGMGHASVHAEGALSAASGLISLEAASVSIAHNQGEGSLHLQMSPGRPLIDATLAFAELDLGEAAPWLAAGLDDTAGNLAGKPSGSAAKLIDAVDADLRLSADVIRMGGLVTGHGAISASWRNDGLTVQLAGLDLYGGGASGQLDLRPRPDTSKAQLALKLDNVDLRRLLSAMGLKAPLDANSHVAVALTAAGRSWREAREQLTGAIAVSATERAVTSGGLERAVIAAMGRDGGVQRGSRVVDGLDWQIAIEGGIMTKQSLAFDVDGIRYGAGVAVSKDDTVQPIAVEARSIDAQ